MIGYYAYLLRYDADIKPYPRSLFKWYIHHKFFKYNVSNLSYRPDTKQSWASTSVDHEMHKTLRRIKIKIWRRPRLAPLHTKSKKKQQLWSDRPLYAYLMRYDANIQLIQNLYPNDTDTRWTDDKQKGR